jgi:hypothetical protein
MRKRTFYGSDRRLRAAVFVVSFATDSARERFD